jgi:iron(III) transport system ATP-binding protein
VDAIAVSLRDVTKRFGAVVAVDDVTLDVAHGEILALLGPSGCGKTTFLRLVAGFERPDLGTIVLGGRTVAGDGTFVRPEARRAGIVFQDYALFPHMTLAANVGYGVRGRKRDRVEEVLRLVGLSGLGDRYPYELSGGQQQRVALARALAPAPDIVLLDEPFSNLDAALRERVRGEVREILRAAGTTTIFVTHDQEEALSLADRVAVMQDGRLHQVGTPGEVYGRPADLFVAAFVGGANLLSGSAASEGIRHPLGLIAGTPGEAVVVIRPEAVRLRGDPAGRGVVRATTFYGHDQVVDLDLDGVAVRARLGPGPVFRPGERVEVSVDDRDVLSFPVDA